MEIITGESIKNKLIKCGIICTFSSFKITPQEVKYFFTLQNSKDINKVLKLDKVLTLWSGQTMSGSIQGKYYCVTTPAEERKKIDITAFKDLNKAPPYSVILGVDEHDKPQSRTLDDLIHVLIAGTTGSGKSVLLNNIIMGLCCYNTPQDLGVILIDPKRVEFSIYNNLPHLITPPVTEVEQAREILSQLAEEMERRYFILNELKTSKNDGVFKKIIVVIDELADLVLSDKKIKDLLIKLLQKSRACGIHFIVATQSPRASILSGLLLANLPTKIALTCASTRESTLILGHKGAEQLRGKGDALVKTPQDIQEFRVQVPYITQRQIIKLINN